MTVDLTEEEREALIDLLTDQIQSSGAALEAHSGQAQGQATAMRGDPIGIPLTRALAT